MSKRDFIAGYMAGRKAATSRLASVYVTFRDLWDARTELAGWDCCNFSGAGQSATSHVITKFRESEIDRESLESFVDDMFENPGIAIKGGEQDARDFVEFLCDKFNL